MLCYVMLCYVVLCYIMYVANQGCNVRGGDLLEPDQHVDSDDDDPVSGELDVGSPRSVTCDHITRDTCLTHYLRGMTTLHHCADV